jgi:hypothetical protein
MAFSNATIVPPRLTKPHICVREGWWRVSQQRIGPHNIDVRTRFVIAHRFAHKLNHKDN